MTPEQTVSTATVAKFLLLSPHHVRYLAGKGILAKATGARGEPLRGRFNLLGAVNAYIGYLRSRLVSGGGGGNGKEGDYQVSRARRMAANAAIEELRLKRIRGEMHHGSDVEFHLNTMLSACRQRLLAVPSRCAPGLLNKTDIVEVTEAIRAEVYAALSELSDYDPAQFAAAHEQYLASIGCAAPGEEAKSGGNGATENGSES